MDVDDVDGLVHTCTVIYSLLAELSEKDRAMYKGITKKQLRVPVQRLVMILPVEESEVPTGDVEHEQGFPQEGTKGDDELVEDDSGKSSVTCTNAVIKENYNWEELGPGLVEHGETSLLSVMRKDSKLFDLVNLDWYRSDTVANSDSSSSSTDLWLHFKCLYGSQDYTAVRELEKVLEDNSDDD